MDDEKKKKPNKWDRMAQHITDACLAEGRQRKECERMAWAVVMERKKPKKEKN